MDLANLVFIGLALALALYIIVIVNRSPHFGMNSGVQGVLWALLAINFAMGTLALVNAILSQADALPTEGAVEITLSAGLISFVLAAFVMAIGALSIHSPQFRARLRGTLDANASYDPNSLLHTAALILILLLIASNLITFFLVGGIEGMADNIAVDGIDFIGVLLQQLLWIATALLGVGLFSRRALPAVLERLGLRVPSPREVGAGVGIEGDRVTVDPASAGDSRVPVSYSGLNRMSVLLVGPLLHRIGEAFGQEIVGTGHWAPVALALRDGSGIRLGLLRANGLVNGLVQQSLGYERG